MADFFPHPQGNEEITLPLDSKVDTKIPIPSPDFLRKVYAPKQDPQKGTGRMFKYEKEYDAFCKWVALPKDLRKPKTIKDFEKKWMLPKTYTEFFRTREDFQERRLQYFWEWMMDKFPDVVHAIYRRGIDKSSKDAGLFVELISKHIKLDKPQVQIAPMMLVGVPQEKIDKLFVPKGYEDVRDITPKSEE